MQANNKQINNKIIHTCALAAMSITLGIAGNSVQCFGSGHIDWLPQKKHGSSGIQSWYGGGRHNNTSNVSGKDNQTQ